MTRTDNAQLKDFDINLHIPLPSLFQEEREVIPVGQSSESASTISNASPLSTPSQSTEAESAQRTSSTHASDQVNMAFFPLQSSA